MPEFKYDFTGIDANAAIKFREQLRGKMATIPKEPSKQEAGEHKALDDLDVALGEHIYQLVLAVQKGKKPGDIMTGS